MEEDQELQGSQVGDQTFLMGRMEVLEEMEGVMDYLDLEQILDQMEVGQMEEEAFQLGSQDFREAPMTMIMP